MRSKISTAILFFVTILSLTTGQVFANQNVLLIIADDLGVDVLNINHDNNKVQVTTKRDLTGVRQAFDLPNISTLLANGVYFTNAWAAPVCSPTRATIYTGMQPWRTGVGYAVRNDVLEDTLPDGTAVNTIANAICDGTTTKTCALFGKWHLGGDDNPVGDINKTPLDRGWDYYAGNLGSHLPGDTYENWPKYTLGSTKDRYIVEQESTYATQDVVDEAKTWIAAQTGPWFATLAFNAPHSPFHVPPDTTYNPATFIDPEPLVDNDFDERRKYNAMIQALDYYVGKLWDSNYGQDISDKLRNTLVIFLGDNGTPGSVANVPRNKAKDSVYLGGIQVPLIIADGARLVNPKATPIYLTPGVLGETQDNQVNVADLFRTIIARIGATVPKPFGRPSRDLSGFLRGTIPSNLRTFNFSQKFTNSGRAYATISDGKYKLNYQDGHWELFNLTDNPTESDDLNLSADSVYQRIKFKLWAEMRKHQMTDTPQSFFPPPSEN